MTAHHSTSRARALPFAALVSLGLLAGLLASLPAFAADHAGRNTGEASAASDPFAAYDAALNNSASRTLEIVTQSQHLPSAGQSPQRPNPDPVSMSGSIRNDGSKLGPGLQRVKRLFPVVDPILRQVGIPAQLAAVVLVESGGDPMALSPKGARGLWQLMPDTARRYGLIVNAETDQRLDVLRSTRAAAEYLRDLYAEFHDWPLALAAYNAGDEAVQRAMAQTGGTEFSTAGSALPVETREYVPAVFNALARFGSGTLKAPTNGARFWQVMYATGER